MGVPDLIESRLSFSSGMVTTPFSLNDTSFSFLDRTFTGKPVICCKTYLIKGDWHSSPRMKTGVAFDDWNNGEKRLKTPSSTVLKGRSQLSEIDRKSYDGS